jgi:glycosyltransferase involved in cell wall biosynthesis
MSEPTLYGGNSTIQGSLAFTPSCTVVICTRNRPKLLDRCIAAVHRVEYPGFEVLVVDNASTGDETRDVAGRRGVRYMVEPVPGLSRARNRGARACGTEIVAFIDDDAIAEPGWLAALTREFNDPLVVAATGTTIPLKVETEAERWCALAEQPATHERRVVDRQTPEWFELASFGGLGNGMNMAFRRRAFDLWPGFHERLGRGTVLRGSEEHYAFLSLLGLGYRVVHTPQAVVRHPFPSTMRDLRSWELKDLAAAMGYVTFLFVEEPRHRRALIKYVIEALRGKPRLWRGEVRDRPRIVPWGGVLVARACGPLLYAWSRVTRKRSLVGGDVLQVDSGHPTPANKSADH